MDQEVQDTPIPLLSQSHSMPAVQSQVSRTSGLPGGDSKTHPVSSSHTLHKRAQMFFWQISKINWVNKWVLFNALTHCANIILIRSELIPSFQKAIFHQPCTNSFPDQVFKGIAPLPPTHQLPLPPYLSRSPAAQTITSWSPPLLATPAGHM